MASLEFPNSPTPGQLYPDPATVGVTQYQWNDTIGVWNEVHPTPVSVQPQPAPANARDGDLWYDCTTGTLKVYQMCTGVGGWTEVSPGGLPVSPTTVTAAPAFSSGAGTLANPYVCAVTTVNAGTTAILPNTVIVTGLAPYQYVQVSDMNAVINQGRFSFTNSYADALGVLTFQIVFDDSPSSVFGTTFTALIRIGSATAYVTSEVNIGASFTTTPGTISGTPLVGQTLTYSSGTATLGVPPYTYAWAWRRDGVAISGATASTYVLTPADDGKNITVYLSVTDATGATANATTSPVGPVTSVPFPSGTWNPSPSGAMTSGSPGTSSGTWNGGTETITATGCVEVSTDGTTYSSSLTVNTGDTLYQRWIQSPLCGDAASGATITGTVSTSQYLNSYSLTLDRVPTTIADISDTNVNVNAAVTQAIASPIAGINTTAYVTYTTASTGTNIQASTDNVTFTTLMTSGTGFAVSSGQTLYIRQTTGTSASTPYVAVIRVGDGSNLSGTYDEFTYTATTTSTPAFPNLPSSLQTGPAQTPGTVSGTWADGPVVLSSTGCILISTDNVTFSQGPLSVNTGNTLYEKWNPTGSSCGDAANGTTITGTITNGTYINSYSLVIDRNPAAVTLTAITGQGPSTTATSNTVTLTGTNAPTYITYTAGSPNTLSSLQVSINSGAYVSVPTSGTSVSAPPGATLTFQGDTGSSLSTAYTVSVRLGTVSNTWSVTTAATLDPGTPYAGGFYAGQINLGGPKYNLVVAPVSEGSLQGEVSGILWATGASNDTVADNTFYGSPATTTYANAQHPAFDWAINDVNGPNAGAYDATNTAGTGIGGYNDWYIPSQYEAMILYYYFKPTSALNDFGTGTNPYAVAPNISPFTPFDPALTTATGFEPGDPNAFSASNYLTATQSGSSNFISQQFAIGLVDTLPKTAVPTVVRAIRRMPA